MVNLSRENFATYLMLALASGCYSDSRVLHEQPQYAVKAQIAEEDRIVLNF